MGRESIAGAGAQGAGSAMAAIRMAAGGGADRSRLLAARSRPFAARVRRRRTAQVGGGQSVRQRGLHRRRRRTPNADEVADRVVPEDRRSIRLGTRVHRSHPERGGGGGIDLGRGPVWPASVWKTSPAVGCRLCGIFHHVHWLSTHSPGGNAPWLV